LLLSKLQLFSPAHPISPFSQKAKQYFIDAVFVTPVIFVENTVASEQALSRERRLTGFRDLFLQTY
jgi:hypothetical protein